MFVCEYAIHATDLSAKVQPLLGVQKLPVNPIGCFGDALEAVVVGAALGGYDGDGPHGEEAGAVSDLLVAKVARVRLLHVLDVHGVFGEETFDAALGAGDGNGAHLGMERAKPHYYYYILPSKPSLWGMLFHSDPVTLSPLPWFPTSQSCIPS